MVFKGSAEAITALLGGHIDFVVIGAVNAVAHVGAGRMRVLAVASPQRLGGVLAAVPTWKEQGVDLEYGSWQAIFGPKGLTPAQVAYWESALRKVTETAEWKADLEKNYWTDDFVTGAQLKKSIEHEYLTESGSDGYRARQMSAGSNGGKPVAAADPAAESDALQFGKPTGGWRARLYAVVFESDTEAGKLFDVVLIVAILLSVAAVLADSVDMIARRHGRLLRTLEWIFTILFTLENTPRDLRICRASRAAMRRASLESWTWLPFCRLISPCCFRKHIFSSTCAFCGCSAYSGSSSCRLHQRIPAARPRDGRERPQDRGIPVRRGDDRADHGHLCVRGRGPRHGFTEHPDCGLLGDHDRDHGRIRRPRSTHRYRPPLASIMMLVGWGILAVPTGIVTAEMTARRLRACLPTLTRTCPGCGATDHEIDSRYSRRCGAQLF